jgi:peptide/nickel transport system permease protein
MTDDSTDASERTHVAPIAGAPNATVDPLNEGEAGGNRLASGLPVGPEGDGAAEVRERPPRHVRFWREFRQNKLGLFGLAIFLAVVVVAVAAPALAPHDPTQPFYDHISQPPSEQFPLGTDSQGRGILSRIIWGARVSLKVGVIAVGFALTVGTAVGIVSGYEGGIVDDAIMRVIDGMMAIPVLALALVLMSVLGFGLTNVMLAVGIVYIPTFARLARGSTLTVKEKEYITAIDALGASRPRILLKHVLPNILSPILVQATLSVAFAILAEAGLSFLGLGTQPPTPSWGVMLSDGRNYLRSAPWIATFPGLAIMITIFGLNTLGDALRDVLDPKESTEERF